MQAARGHSRRGLNGVIFGSAGWRKMKKSELSQKICAVCQRPFSWRKKWEKVWEDVKYCSDKCRGQRQASKAKGGGDAV
ncbi:DUF2256 domain-containing protein [Albirhodobacter sp. R86504]|uniref:DUF2256 domain-containing protein n=1 Tax=Albirhodobacter sp. R86504 TaxID=3093848 RepID=UPI00366B38BF